MYKRILANDGIEADGKTALEAAGFTVDTNKVEQADLAKALQQILNKTSGFLARRDDLFNDPERGGTITVTQGVDRLLQY